MLIDSTVRPLTYTFKELIIFILRLRQLVGFVHEKESIGNIMIFVSLMILLIYLIINRLNKLKTYKQQLFFNRCNIWLFISFFFLVLYFTVPDKISAGSLTNRIGLFFFINLIIGLAIKQYNKKVLLFALIIFFSGYSYLQIYRMRFYPRQNKFVDCIKQVEEYIEPNSTIYHIRDSWNWIDSHFTLYLGIDKPILNIRNTQNHG